MLVTSRRLPRALMAAYLVFLVYGSFFPVEFRFDSAVLRRGLDHSVLALHDASGHRTGSFQDFASNVLVGGPFGLLTVCAGLTGASLPARLIVVALLDLLLASASSVRRASSSRQTAPPRSSTSRLSSSEA